MMQLPTGGGKTVIAAHLLRDYLTGRRKAVWLTHRKELASQTERMLTEAGILATTDARWVPGERAPSIANSVVILMAQTVGLRTKAAGVWSSYYKNDLLIIDEAHHATAQGWERAIKQWPGKVLGMTATPWRLSRKEGFNHLFGDLILGPQVGELQNDEFLCEKCQTASPAASHSCRHCNASFGKKCPQCVKWHAFRSGWWLEDLCPPDAHDSVCDQCHNDAHHKANLPHISPLEYIRHKGISLRESSFPHEDKQIVIAAVLEILLEMEGRGKRIIVIRKVADKLKDIFLETLLKAENSKSVARIVERSYVERIYRNLLCSDNSPWGGKIPQGFKQLEKGGYCDRPVHGIWRLTQSGRELADSIMLKDPKGDE